MNNNIDCSVSHRIVRSTLASALVIAFSSSVGAMENEQPTSPQLNESSFASSGVIMRTAYPNDSWADHSLVPYSEVLFVDGDVEDANVLLQGIKPYVRVVKLAASGEPLKQIAQALRGMRGLRGIHILSHGQDGQLLLGGQTIDRQRLKAERKFLRMIGKAIQPGGDILLYGCDVAASGKGIKFIKTLAAYTGADVTASNDRTGARAKGGDWELEISTGRIDSHAPLAAAAMESYNYDLATVTVTNGNDSGAGSLRQAILDATSGDTINFDASYTITLTTVGDDQAVINDDSMLLINKNLTIDGGANTIVLDGAHNGRVLKIATSTTVTLSNLTIQNGLLSGDGGRSNGTPANQNGGNVLGAGIYNAGTLTITGSTVTANKAAGGGGAGDTYAGGGGGGFSSKGGGAGGVDYSGNYGGGGGSGTGGNGGPDNNSGGSSGAELYGGRGGSTTGGSGGTDAGVGGSSVGGSGGSANAGGNQIGGGGGGAGYALDGANGGTGGSAAAGIYNTGTLTITSSTISNNAGAGGGGGAAIGGNNGGDGGRGVGAIWNEGGTLNVDSTTNSNITSGSNSGTSGTGGTGTSLGATPTADNLIWNDGNSDGTEDTINLDTNYSPNVSPSITNLNGDSFTYTEGDAATKIDQGSNATVSDSDSADFNTGNLTVTITSGKDAAEDILSLDVAGTVSLGGTTAGSNVLVSSNIVGTLGNNIAAGNDLVVNFTTANATPGNVQTLVQAITYQNSDTDAPTTGARNVRTTVNDGDGGTSTNSDVTVTVAGVNDAPTTTNLNGDSFTYTEDDPATIIDQGGNATVADVDSADFNTGALTVTITSGGDAAEDVLSLNTGGTVTLAGTTAGSNVSVGGNVVGTLGNNIAAGNDLVVNFTTANATPTNVQTLVRAITYQNSDTSAPTTGARNVRTTITDGDGGTSVNADVTVTVAAANDAPTTTNLNGDSFTYTEGDAATVIDQGGNATVADVDSADFNTGALTVTITSGGDAAEDVLSLNTGGTVTLAGTTAGSNVSVGGNVVGTLGNNIAAGNDLVVNFTTANATPTNAQTLVRAITYQNSDTDAPTTGARNVRTTINDGDGGTSVNADVTVTVAGVNDAPTTTNLNGDSFTYTEGDAATVIDQAGNATVADVDSADFNTGALTVTITSGEDAAEDILSLDTTGTVALGGTTAGSSVSVSGSAVGTLGNNIAAGNDLVVNFTTSNATPTNVQTLVRSITYQNSDTDAPTTGARNVRTTISDGDGGTSVNADVTVTVAAVNDDPAIASLPTDVTVTEDTTSNVDLSAATFSDADSASSSITLTIAAAAGTLTSTSAGGVTIGGSGTGTITLSGTAANIDTFLNTASNIQYTGATNSYGNNATTLTLTGNDGGNTGSGGGTNVGLGTVNIDITAVGDTPTVSDTTTLEDTQSSTGLVIDRNANDGSEVTHFKITGISGGALYKNSLDGGGQITNGTFITYAEGNHGLRFMPTSNSNADGIFYVQAGTDGVGGGLSASSAQATITITPVNDPPTLTNLSGDSVNFSVGSSGAELDASADATLSDIDSPDFNGGTITVTGTTNYLNTEDVFKIGTVGNISTSGSNVIHSDSGGLTIGTFVGGTAIGSNNPLVITLNANATLARVRDLLSALQYYNAESVANLSQRTITIVVVDGDGTANGGSDTSATQTVTVNIQMAPLIDLDVDDSSGATDGDYNGSFTEDGSVVATADAGDTSITDDGTFKSMTVTLTNILDGTSEYLASTYGTGSQTVNSEAVTIGTYNNGTGELVITVNDASTNATTMQMLMESIRYGNSSDVPNTTSRSITYVAVDNVDNIGPVSTATISVTAVNDQPAFTGLDGAPAFTEGGSVVTLDTNVVIADLELDVADNYNGATLTLARNGGTNANDQFSASGTLSALTESGSFDLGSGSIGTVTTNSGGTLVLTFNSSATASDVDSVLQQIAYSNGSDAPAASVQIDWTFSDGNTGSQGSGGALTASGSTTASITGTNDSPTGTATISGTAAEYQILTAVTSGINDPDGFSGTYSYQWKSSGSNVGTDSATYTVATSDIGNTITVTVSYSDDFGTSESVSSSATSVVANTNDLPSGQPTISGTVTEDQTLSVSTTGISDADGLGAFSYQWKRNGSAISGATNTSYTLGDNDVGNLITITVSYTDGGGANESVTSSATAAVANVNDAPTGTVSISGSAVGGQVLTASNTLADADGLGTIAYQWKRNGSAISGATAATYTLTIDDVGATITVTASYTDNQGNAESMTSSATTAVISGNTIPVVTAPASVTVNATGLFTKVELGTATATDAEDGDLTPSSDSDGYFSPGTHTVTWSATDSANAVGTASQTVNVVPLVGFSKNQNSAEGSTVSFKVILNGPAVTYPVTVPYTVGGTAATDGSDHDLSNGSVTIADQDLAATVTLNLVNDGAGEGVETLVVTMGTPTNAVKGPAATHTITIYEDNVAPDVQLTADQGSGATRIVGQADGLVTVRANVTDPNSGDTHTYDWSATDNALVDGDTADGTFTIDPSGLTPGVYSVKVTVSDGQASGKARLDLKVEAALPVLTSADSDGDGTSDSAEGLGDSDSDGIPDYLDHSGVAANVVQEKQTTAASFLMEAEPGLRLSLGSVAFRANGDRTGVTEDDVATHANNGAGAQHDSEDYSYSGGVFDFNVDELPQAGQSVSIVIAQFSAIPAYPIYRKLMATGWQDFVVDSNNRVSSAPGAAGYCPPPGDDTYVSGLIEGYWCVQLTIEDGGPNDSDGEVNGSVSDPGGVAARAVKSISIKITGKGGLGSISYPWLLLLGLVVVLRYRAVRRSLCLLPLFAVVNSAQAENDIKPYVGAAYLGVTSEERRTRFDQDISALGISGDVTHTDLSRNGLTAYAGIQVTEFVGAEFGYVDLGEATTRVDATTGDVAGYLAAISDIHPTSANGLSLNLVLRKPFKKLDLIAKVGALAWQADYRLASGSFKREYSENGTNFTAGIAIERELTYNVPFRLGWDVYKVSDIKMEAWLLGIGYRFP